MDRFIGESGYPCEKKWFRHQLLLWLKANGCDVAADKGRERWLRKLGGLGAKW